MSNTFTGLMTVLMARSLRTLRENCVLPSQVNNDIANIPVEQGDAINMSIPSALTVSDVTPSATQVTPPDSAPTKTTVTLNRWRKSGFHLTDKERGNIINGIAGGMADEAIKALANDVNAYLFSLYTGVYGYTGTAGTTPFASDLSSAAGARAVLNRQLAPVDGRRLILDVDADAKFIANPYIAAAYARGDTDANKRGILGPVVGFEGVMMDQAVPTHVSTALTAGNCTVNGVNALGASTVSIAKATNTSPLVVGDIISFAGDTQTYVVTTGVTLAVGNTSVAISPPLKKATVGGELVTLRASHVVNLAFHRDAIAFASRPLQTEAARGNTMSVADPKSGLVLRLEMIRQNKQDYMEFDILYGATLVRPEFAARLAG